MQAHTVNEEDTIWSKFWTDKSVQSESPGFNGFGHIALVLSMRLSVVNFNHGNIFLTMRYKDFAVYAHIYSTNQTLQTYSRSSK